jgi:hypothetical protein
MSWTKQKIVLCEVKYYTNRIKVSQHSLRNGSVGRTIEATNKTKCVCKGAQQDATVFIKPLGHFIGHIIYVE